MNSSAFQLDLDFDGFRVCASRLLLPTSAKRAVQLHDGERLVLLGNNKVELSGVVVGVVGQHLNITCRTAVVSKLCQPSCILCRHGQFCFLHAEFAEFLESDQSIGYTLKCLLDSLLIGEYLFLLLRLGEPQIVAKFARIEDRLCKVSAGEPVCILTID